MTDTTMGTESLESNIGKAGLTKVLFTSIKYIVQFTLFLPLEIWKSSYTWISKNSQGTFFETIKEKNFQVLASFEAIQHTFIFLSWVIGAILTALMSISAGAGYGGAGAAISMLIVGLIMTYIAPMGIAITRELLAILLQLGKGQQK